MQDPGTRTQMETKMKTLKEDPELKHIIEELETGGPAAMMKCDTPLPTSVPGHPLSTENLQ